MSKTTGKTRDNSKSSRGPHLAAVVLDLDDTLYLERDYARSGLLAVGRYLASHGHVEGIGEWMWQEFCQGRHDQLFNAANEHFRLHLEPIHLSDMVEYYRNHRPQIQPTPEALALLEALRGRVKLGLLSDGFLPAQQYKLDALGLRGRFDAVLFTESLGRAFWKPSPVGFEKLAAELGVPNAACAYVGDNPAKDFLAPNQLGWRTVQWRQEGQVHADKTAPAGGAAQHLAGSVEEVLSALGLPHER